MTKNDVLVRVAATLTTLLETNGSPASMIYLAFGANMSEWQMLESIMKDCGWIVVKGHYVTLTEAGKLKAQEINAKIKN